MSETDDGGLADRIEAIEDAAEIVREDVDVLRAAAGRRRLRVEYLFFGLVILFFAAYGLAYLVLDVDLDSLREWGYLGIFLISLAGSATIVLPTPANFAIVGSTAVVDPIFGVPAPVMVGLVAGLGEAIGEFSGYGLGYAGTDLVKDQKLFPTFERWMTNHGVFTIFFLSTFPNPLFDMAGTAAGAARMPPARFFTATLAGKFIKNLILAYGGSVSIDLIRDALN